MGLKAERRNQTSSHAPKRKNKRAKRAKRASPEAAPPRKIYYITRPTPEEKEREERIFAEMEARGELVRPKGTIEERLKRLERLLDGDPEEHRRSGEILQKALKESGGVRI